MALFGSVIPSDAQGGFSFRNKIINGDFNIWQRGTSFSSSSVNEYSADRYRTEGYAHTSVVSRQTFTVGQTDVPGYPTYFCRVASSTTVSAGQYWAFIQRIETPQVISGSSGSGSFTLSFWAKSTTSIPAGSFSYGIEAANQSSPALTTTWQKITQTVVVGNNESSGFVPVYLVYFAPTQGNKTVDIANVQVEYGPRATPFERRPYGVELQLCQRYYLLIADGTLIGSGYLTNTNYLDVPIRWPVQMRAAPAVSKNGTWNVSGNNGQPTISLSGVNGCSIRITSTITGQAYATVSGGSGNPTLSADIEL
jgi:hypothetical protein